MTVKALFARGMKAFFAPVAPLRGASASSIGLLVGLFPIHGYSFPAMLVFSALFSLNLFAMLLGAAVSLLFPFFRLLSAASFDHLQLRFAFLSESPSWLGTLIAGLLLAVFFYPLFALLFHLPLTRNLGTRGAVFQDNSGRRGLLLKRFGIAAGSFVLLIVAIFGVSIGVNPLLPQLSFGLGEGPAPSISPVAEKLSDKTLMQELKEEERAHPTFQLDYRPHRRRVSEAAAKSKNEVYGFYVNWDSNSKQSLLENGKTLTTLLPEWYFLKPDLTIDDQTDPSIIGIAHSQNTKVEPLLSNYADGRWNGASVHKLLNDALGEKRLIASLYAITEAREEAGINVDFEGIASEDQDALTAFVGQLAAKFHAGGLQVTEDVPADDDAFDYGALAKAADRLIVMMYDEHESGSEPGPIASENWFEQSLDQLDIPPDKMVVSLGSYGYDWTEGSHAEAEDLTFGDIMVLAQQSKLIIQWDDKTRNPYMRYKENGDSHIVWFLDAATLYNEVQSATDSGFRGIALWRLGSEDPSVWKSLADPNAKPAALASIRSAEPVRYEGQGEILRISEAAREGSRSFDVDDEGSIDDETYRTFPAPYVIDRYGKPKGKKVVLTFDDGPSGRYTPQILDVLARYHIRATFFVVGENAEMHPELVAREYREGHELGNHTYTHPNVAQVSPFRTRMELNATQRLVQEITGHSMTMFRPPYVADAEPSTPAELLPILRGQAMGYTMVGELIDPEDWARPTAQEIVRRVLSQLGEGNVILLHDAGGNREQTVKALPMIIDRLKAQGYTFSTVSELAGKTREETMPSVNRKESKLLVYDRTVFDALMDWNTLVEILLGTAIMIGVMRVALLGTLAWRQKKRYRPIDPDDAFKPLVSVVIAAYNEERVIVDTIRSVLASDYPRLEILVVDDGSTDGTLDVLREEFGNHPGVRVIAKPNGGKASAVNAGFRSAQGEFIVAFDADTLLAADAISRLIRHFKDERVAAVSGNVKVGNVRNLLTIWQHIEYVTGFNLERRAFDRLNCITVVPGAIGAWRKSAVMEAGGYKEETLAEDTDLTITLLRRGHVIEYEERAYAWTEAPEDLRSFLKQRYRWTYGTLQCLWKHRGALLRPKQAALGYVGLPNMWLFQYVYQTLAPLIDVLFIFSLFTSGAGKATGYYAAFFLLDLAVAVFAFRLEGAKLRPLAWLFLQRIVYRQFMTFVIVKAILAALSGAAVGWNKLKRKGLDSSQGKSGVA